MGRRPSWRRHALPSHHGGGEIGNVPSVSPFGETGKIDEESHLKHCPNFSPEAKMQPRHK
jgi:hypothetical protein